MTFASDISDATAQVSQAPGQRTLLNTAFTTLESSLNTIMVTNAGKTAAGAEYVAIQESIIRLARQCALVLDDYTS